MTNTKVEAIHRDAHPSVVLEKVFEIVGGREAFDRLIDESVARFNAAWDRDTDRIGRVLRAHLAIEHFLTRCIEAANPRLGSLDDARLSFAQKVELAAKTNHVIGALLPGIRRLNQVRNRIVHRLEAEITVQDRDVFLSVAIFATARAGGATRLAKGSDARLDVLEEFAHFAAGFLHANDHPAGDAFRKAFEYVESLKSGQDEPTVE